jgi:riboflavin biosynthesis pyrimidine reductase
VLDQRRPAAAGRLGRGDLIGIGLGGGVWRGPGLLGRLFSQRLVNVAWIFVAPLLFGDEEALPCVRGLTVTALTDGCRMRLLHVRRRGDDVILHYRVA